MAIDRSPKDIEYFDNPREVFMEDDRLELDIRVIGWSKMFRIRALSFGQMEKINANAKDSKGDLDQASWVYHTITEGVVRPMFTINQAKELADNNGAFVRELADEIWQIGRISRKQWDAFIAEQERLTKLDETGNPDV